MWYFQITSLAILLGVASAGVVLGGIGDGVGVGVGVVDGGHRVVDVVVSTHTQYQYATLKSDAP